jgi:retron-type reverse transcriptase
MLMDTVFSEQHFPYPVGRMLTDICTRNGSVPQGACTSPAISNIVMKEFDDRMGRWCSYRGISYTRYSDDLTFSSDEPLYPAYRKARRMLEEMGFGINDDKTHFITSAGRQQVTGLVVNDKLGVPADYRRRLRQEIYYVLKYGARDAFSRSDDCRNDPGMTLRRYLLRLIGKTEYVTGVRRVLFRSRLADLEPTLDTGNHYKTTPAAAWPSSSADIRSEERRVGKECRSRWSPYQ